MTLGRFRGAAALIFTLGLIAIASAVAAGIVEFAALRLKPRASAALGAELKLDAESALNTAVAVLREYAEIDGGIYAESQGWGRPIADGRVKFDGCEADVKISDESGKIPLSSMDSEKFVKIFEEWGMSAASAQRAADCIADWCDSDDARGVFGAEYDDYGRGEPRPPNRAFKSFSELAFVKNANEIFFDADGNPTDFYRIISENFSLENFSKVNLNSASEETLAILCELESEDYDPDLYRAIRGEIGSVDGGKYWVESLSDIENRGARFVPRAMAAASASLLKIEVTARRGIAEYKIVAFYGTETSSGRSGGSDGSRTNSSSSGVAGNSHSGGNSGGASGAMTYGGGGKSSAARASSMKVLKIYERGIL